MMGIVINANSYGTAYDAMEAQYGEEIMCTGWNPTVALVCQQQTACVNGEAGNHAG